MSDDPIMSLAMAAHRRGINRPERVTAALEAIIHDQQNYLARRSRQGLGAHRFNEEVVRRNEVLAAAIFTIDSRADDQAWLRRYTEHVITHVLPGIPEDVLAKVLSEIPPMPEEEES